MNPLDLANVKRSTFVSIRRRLRHSKEEIRLIREIRC